MAGRPRNEFICLGDEKPSLDEGSEGSEWLNLERTLGLSSAHRERKGPAGERSRVSCRLQSVIGRAFN